MASPSSLSPPVVPMELHVVNRKKLLDSFRDHLSLSSLPLHGFIFLQGGEEQTRHCTDHTELFRQESYFSYLFGVQEPEFYGAIDIASGDSILFAPRLPAEYAVWLGEIKSLSHFKERYMVSSVFYTDEIAKVLHQQYQVPGKPLLYLLHGLNTDSNNFSKPADFKGIDDFETDLNALHPILTECRVIKSALELAVIQFANDISSEAHVEVMRKAKAGMKEYQLESLFLHHTYMYGGCRHCSYTCICATGSNSSTLHYGHAAAPNDKTLEDGDMALLDMGAEYHCYGSDITCSFPVNGKFTGDQSLVYNAVLHAHDAVISNMRPGVSWVDMHKLAERVILESLKEGNLLLGDVDAMVQERVGAVFLPHGLGHLLGIDTHDPGGYLKGAERPKEPGLKSLRTSRELLEGMVITVEPGCYFIDALLLPAMKNAQTSKFFNHEQISRFRGLGGVRIESDVFVTSDGCVNMTKCPREIKDIEAVMAGAPWPINKACTTGESQPGDPCPSTSHRQHLPLAPTGLPESKEKDKEVVFKGSYTMTETNVLVRMWIDTSIDPIIGNNQKGVPLWSRINKQYHQLIPDPTRTRMNMQLKSHFHRVGRAVKAFKAIHDKNMSKWKNDSDDLDIYMMSLQEYKQQKGTDFKYKEPLDLLSRTPRFWEVEPCAQSSTSKKRKNKSVDSFTSESSNDEPAEGFEQPQGATAAKKKEETKISTDISQVIKNTRNSIEELVDTQILHLDMKMFNKDTSRMNPEQLTVYMKVREEIKARRGW